MIKAQRGVRRRRQQRQKRISKEKLYFYWAAVRFSRLESPDGIDRTANNIFTGLGPDTHTGESPRRLAGERRCRYVRLPPTRGSFPSVHLSFPLRPEENRNTNERDTLRAELHDTYVFCHNGRSTCVRWNGRSVSAGNKNTGAKRNVVPY